MILGDERIQDNVNGKGLTDEKGGRIKTSNAIGSD